MEIKWFFSAVIIYFPFVSSGVNAFSCLQPQDINLLYQGTQPNMSQEVNLPGPQGGTWRGFITSRVGPSLWGADSQDGMVCYYSSVGSNAGDVTIKLINLQGNPKIVDTGSAWQPTHFCYANGPPELCAFDLEYSEADDRGTKKPHFKHLSQ